MSKHFTPVEFKLSDDPGKPKRPEKIISVNKDKFEIAIKEIEAEFAKIKIGESDLLHYAVDNKDFGSPVGNRFKILKGDPTVGHIKAFLELAKQDLGAKAADHFKGLLKVTLEEVPNV